MNKEATIRRAEELASEEIARLKASGEFQSACEKLGIPREPDCQFWRVNRGGILWFREFVKNGGLILDGNYWVLEKDAVGAVRDAIELALINGWDSSKAAARFIYQGPANDVIHTQVDPGDYEEVTTMFTLLINRAHLG